MVKSEFQDEKWIILFIIGASFPMGFLYAIESITRLLNPNIQTIFNNELYGAIVSLLLIVSTILYFMIDASEYDNELKTEKSATELLRD